MQFSVDGTSFFLISGCVLSLIYPLAARISERVEVLLTFLVFLSQSASIALLLYLRVIDDFSFEHVYYNSHTAQPLLYKVFGLWGNYEGSNMLFVWLLSVYALCMAVFVQHAGVRRIALSVQHITLSGFTIFTLFLANPFTRMLTVDDNGRGFNPLLQDIALTIHPPILFAGYTGFSAVMALTIAAVVLRVDPAMWAKVVARWVLNAWTFLTLGIALGGWWAYRELGWGGFWSWDPVENVALLPWLTGTALLHMLPIVRKYRIYCNFTFFLSILVFILSLYSTFLVRSGFLISVHTFATDSSYRGLFLLILVNAISVLSILLYIVSYRRFTESCSFSYVSKITAIISHNVVMLTACAIVLVGTIYPIVLEFLTGSTVSVGAPYYNRVFSILLVVLLSVMVLLSGLDWRETRRFKFSFKISALCTVVLFPLALYYGFRGMILLLAWFLFSSILEDFICDVYTTSIPACLENLRKKSMHKIAMTLAHLGVAVLAFGIVYTNTFNTHTAQYMKEADVVHIRGMQIKLDQVSLQHRQNYDAIVGHFLLMRGDKILGTLVPENRFYPVEGARNLESSIYHTLAFDLYIVVGDIDPNHGIAVQIYYKPLISLVWGGFGLIILGGFLSTLACIRKAAREAILARNSCDVVYK